MEGLWQFPHRTVLLHTLVESKSWGNSAPQTALSGGFGCKKRWLGKLHPSQQRTWKDEDERSHVVSLHSQSTWGSRICHKPEPPHVALPWAVQDGASGSVFAGKHCHRLTFIPPQVASGATGGVADVWELPGHSCSLPCASWRGSRGHPAQAPHSSVPSAHPTWASHPACTLWRCSWAPGASALDHGRAKGQLSHPSTVLGESGSLGCRAVQTQQLRCWHRSCWCTARSVCLQEQGSALGRQCRGCLTTAWG